MTTPLRRLAGLLRPHRGTLAVSSALALVVAALAAVTVGTLKPAVEAIFDPDRMQETLETVRLHAPFLEGPVLSVREAAAEAPVRALALLLAFILVVSVVRAFLRWGHETLVGTVAQEATAGLTERMFRALMRQEVARVQGAGAASFLTRFTADADAVAKGLETLGGALILEPAFFVAYATAALLVSPKLALLAVVATPLLAFLVRRVSGAVRKATRRVLERRQQLVTRVEESLRGIRVVQAYGAEDAEAARFASLNGRLLAEFRRLVRLEAATGPALELLALLGVSAALLVGGSMAARGEVSTGDLFTVGAALAGMYAPLRKIGGAANRVQAALAASARILDVADHEPSIADRPGARPLPPGPGTLSLRGVTVTFPGGTKALDAIDLEIPAGTTVALTGPSGAGKSTLVNLVPRFLDPDAGAVLLDGHDLRDLTLSSLRREIAIVPQEVFLREGTIRENVLDGRPGATDAEVLEACRAARVDEMLERLPGGLDAPVGPAGALLSGGERQRVAVARAMIRDPRVLLLDEPTSSLDARGAALVDEALERLCRGRTVLLVAHRLASAAKADRIVLLDGGRIVGDGTHERLVAESDLYRELAAAGFQPG